MEFAKGKKIVIGIVAALVLLIGGFVTFYFCYKVEPVTDSFVLELGEKLSRDPYDYVSGMDWSVVKSKLDFSAINEDEVGRYQVQLKHGWQTFHYSITIKDTTPPELVLWDKEYYLQQDVAYDITFFMESVFDLSGDVDLQITSPEDVIEDADNIAYASKGNYEVTVTATDPSGNYTVQTVMLLVDTPPVISGMQEHYLAIGCDTEFLNGIVATDEMDGDVSASLTVDMSALNNLETGDYTVTYRAVDQYGFVGENTATVHVLERLALQDKINRHQIDRFGYNIVGAPNVYDAGYYEEDNVKFIQNTMEPCVVRLSRPGKSYGSGFIIRITDKDVIICTNQHVTHNEMTMMAYFHDGTGCVAQLIEKDYDRDIALLKVPKDTILPEVFDTLRSVHINEGYWEDLSDTEAISLCIRTINDNGTVWRDRNGVMLHKLDTPEAAYRSLDQLTRMDMTVFAGSSGSAVFDGHGRLMGMVTMRVSRGGKYISYWAISLKDILDFYEETFAEAPNYY